MMLKAFSSDLLKIRGKGLWFLIALGPVGLVAMQALNFGLRYDYLTQRYAGRMWEALLSNMLMFVPIALYLGVTLVSSLLANVEHSTNSWKQLLALPISRGAIFGAKFALCVLLLSVSCCLLAIGTVALGLSLKFGTDIPFLAILRLSFLPFFASLPALALLLWLSLTVKNQALSVTFGVMAGITSVYSVNLSEWFPLNWPLFGYAGPHQELFVGAGFLCGAVILLCGALHFNKKDVN